MSQCIKLLVNLSLDYCLAPREHFFLSAWPFRGSSVCLLIYLLTYPLPEPAQPQTLLHLSTFTANGGKEGTVADLAETKLRQQGS